MIPVHRFLADECFDQKIVRGLLKVVPADVLTASKARLLSLPDEDILAFAAKENRVLITHDLATMPIHFGNRLVQGMHCAGVVLVPWHLPVAMAIEQLAMLSCATDQKFFENRILSVPINLRQDESGMLLGP